MAMLTATDYEIDQWFSVRLSPAPMYDMALLVDLCRAFKHRLRQVNQFYFAFVASLLAISAITSSSSMREFLLQPFYPILLRLLKAVFKTAMSSISKL